MAEKEFDCIAMKREGAARIYETVKGMTREEELAYWKMRGEELEARLHPRPSAKHSSVA